MSSWDRNRWIEDAKERVLRNAGREDAAAREMIFLYDEAANNVEKEINALYEWKVGKIQKRGDEYYIEVYNNVEYAEPVEYGHRTRGGKGFVPGSHMMEVSLAEVAALLPGYLLGWLNDFISTHDL